MKKIFKNNFQSLQSKSSLILGITRITNAVFGFLFWIIVSRFSELDEVGIASSFISIFVLIGTMFTIGLDQSYAQFAKKSVFRIKIPLILSTVNGIGVLIYFFSFDAVGIYQLAGISIFALLFFDSFFRSFTLTSDGYFIGINKFNWLLIRVLIENLTRFISILIFMGNMTFLNIILSWFISLALSSIFCVVMIFFRKREDAPKETDIISVRDLIKSGIPVHIGSVLYTFTPLILPTLLIMWVSEELSGSFYISWMIVNAFYSLMIALSIAAVATIKRDDRHKGLKTLLIYYSVIIGIAAIISAFFSDFILRIFNPDLIETAKSFLQLLLFSLAVVAFYQFRVTDLRIKESFSNITIMNCFQGTIFFTLLFIFKTSYGLLGIGGMFLISVFLSVLISYMVGYIRKLILQKQKNKPEK